MNKVCAYNKGDNVGQGSVGQGLFSVGQDVKNKLVNNSVKGHFKITREISITC